MDSRHNSEAQLDPPSPWFVLCQVLAGYSTLFLAVIGIAATVDHVIPGRSLRAEVLVGVIGALWAVLVRRSGLISKPKRPKSGARLILFTFYFLFLVSISQMWDWWAGTATFDSADRVVGTFLVALVGAGLMSLSEKGVWQKESVDPTVADQAPPRTV